MYFVRWPRRLSDLNKKEWHLRIIKTQIKESYNVNKKITTHATKTLQHK
jgi:hypothetical protein